MKASQRKLLFVLMAPFIIVVSNLSMFRVAIPTIRSTFNLPADSTAWLDTAYTLAYMVFMPLYGRLGDRISKRRLFIAEIFIFSAGTLLVLFSSEIGLIIAGRVIQAVGVAGISPLCIATIANRFPDEERGAALGKWNSTGAFVSMIGPFVAGFLIDRFNWRSIYLPILGIAVIAVVVVWKLLSAPQSHNQSRETYRNLLTSFDWVGAFAFACFLTLFVFYLSSRPITGRDPLTDWRLVTGAAVALLFLILWERRAANPIIPIDMLRYDDFLPATMCSAIRMFVMSGFNILVPLYLTEIHGLSASWVGAIIAAIFLAHFISMRIGGALSDRQRTRTIVITGLSIQGAVLIFLALIGDSISYVYLIPVLMIHSLGAGGTLAPLHRAAMAQIPHERTGAGAGFYSSVRFGGVLLGPTIAGVVLENGLVKYASAVQAYQRTFLVVFIGVIVAILTALKVKD